MNAGFLLIIAKTDSKVGWEKQENIAENSYKKNGRKQGNGFFRKGGLYFC